MPVRLYWIYVALLTISLLGSGNVLSACDQTGKPAVFGIGDKWEVPKEKHLGQADFSEACGALIACYGSEGAIKRSCDRVYEKNLGGACRKTFRFTPNALEPCMEKVNQATEFVMQADGATYRKMQRTAQAEKRKAERKADAQARQAKIEDRRKKRREERRRSAEN